MRIAVLIPCLNEEATVGQVVRDFKAQLPDAEIIVVDNNSTDKTAECARREGARVFFERRRGKGFVMQRLFQDVDADVYVMVDGDSTYPAAAVHKLMEPIVRQTADMVIGSRLHEGSNSQFRPANRMGNKFFAYLFGVLFGSQLTDILSGYRAFSRNFVRTVSLFGGGFEVEAELTVKALQGGLRVQEIPVDLVPRPAQSESKIRVVRDGFVILSAILSLVRDHKPLTTFGGIGLLFVIIGAIPGTLVVFRYFSTGTPVNVAGAVISVWLVSIGILFIAVGLILHSVSRHFQNLTHRLVHIERDMEVDTESGKHAKVHTPRTFR